MSVLSDGEIRRLMASGQLIIGGDPNRAISCCYEFRPGLVVTTGGTDAKKCVKDWTGTRSATDLHLVGAGEMIWIRTLERVSLPNDLCAFWWQSNRLSRRGLMLVNMSMVEPGSTGHLACLFVNFNKVPIQINPDTVIAKLVFFRMSETAVQPAAPALATIDYDRRIVETAMSAPKTFLAVADIALALSDEKSSAIHDLHAERDQLVSGLHDASREVVIEAKRDFSEDVGRTFRRALGPAAIGFALILAASSFVPWIQSAIQPNLRSQVDSMVQKAVSDRLMIPSDAGEVSRLEARLQQVEQQLRAAQQAAGQPPTTNGNPNVTRSP